MVQAAEITWISLLNIFFLLFFIRIAQNVAQTLRSIGELT